MGVTRNKFFDTVHKITYRYSKITDFLPVYLEQEPVGFETFERELFQNTVENTPQSNTDLAINY